MKTINTIIKSIILIMIGIIIFLLLKKYYPIEPDVIIKTDTIYKTIYKDSIKYDTIIYSNLKLINDTIYLRDTILQIDTIYFHLNEHFAKIHYLDTILNDSTGFISVSDTIFMNKLLNRKSDIRLYNKTKIPLNDKISLYTGLFYLNSVNRSVGVNMSLERKKSMFTVGYGTNKTILINYLYKIR